MPKAIRVKPRRRPAVSGPRKLHVEFFEGRLGWYWHVQGKNGRIRADGGEAYTRRGDAVRAFRRLAVDVHAMIEALAPKVRESWR